MIRNWFSEVNQFFSFFHDFQSGLLFCKKKWNEKRKMEWKSGIKCWTSIDFKPFRRIQNIRNPSSKLPFLESLGTVNPYNPDFRVVPTQHPQWEHTQSYPKCFSLASKETRRPVFQVEPADHVQTPHPISSDISGPSL